MVRVCVCACVRACVGVVEVRARTIRSRRTGRAVGVVAQGSCCACAAKRPPPQPFVSPFWASASRRPPSIPCIPCIPCIAVVVLFESPDACRSKDAAFVKSNAMASCSRRGVTKASATRPGTTTAASPSPGHVCTTTHNMARGIHRCIDT